MKIKVVIMAPQDNVAVALTDLASGSKLDLNIAKKTIHIKLTDHIPYQHKFSLKNINTGSRVIKDGIVIGEATRDIKQGQHVHIHNMTGLRAKAMGG
jgi:altronate dehydratase small subunit